MLICEHCAAKIEEADKFCWNCGGTRSEPRLNQSNAAVEAFVSFYSLLVEEIDMRLAPLKKRIEQLEEI